MDITLCIRSAYIVAATSILFLNTSQHVRGRLILYGPRANLAANGRSETSASKVPGKEPSPSVQALIDNIAGLRVPHAWFTHFYIASVAASLFWAIQYLSGGSLLHWFVNNAGTEHIEPMSLTQASLLWTLMLVQGIRRLLETVSFNRASCSQMWMGHWALGVGFYLLTSCAVWIEGAPAVKESIPPFTSLHLPMPSTKTFIGLPLFFIASGIQNDCHQYLASLKKYSVPQHPAFARLVAPHYFTECLIYLSLAIIGSPPGRTLNRTMICSLIFVASNLGVTAHTSRQWYVKRFGENSVDGKWNMVPFLF